MKLSVIILTHNEEKMLPSCFASIKDWADETIVIDKKSTDQTLVIGRRFGAKIVKYEGEYFDQWRNLGIYHAVYDWLFYLDPDERVTEQLKKEISQIIKNPIFSETNENSLNVRGFYSVYKIPRKNYWWGKEFHQCGAWPDYATRLFLKDKLQKWQGIIHESPIFEGQIGTLKSYLIHLTHRDLISGLKKSMQWTRLEAELLMQANHPPVVWWRLLKVTLLEFLKKYIFEGGFRKGTEGLIECSIQAINRFMVYEQLWEIQQKPSLPQKYQEIENNLKT